MKEIDECVIIPFFVFFGFVRLHSTSAEISRHEVGRRLDLPCSAGHHNGAGQLDDGLRQRKEPAR